MKRQIGSKHYGSALGDWLKGRRGEIAASEAGEGGDANAAAAALAEAFAGACGVPLDDYAKIESGDTDPTPEQADALAAELTKHGVECTGSDLLALDKSEEPKAEPKPEDEAQESADAEMRKALEASQHEAVTLRAQVGETGSALVALRGQLDEASARLASLEPLADIGRAAVEERRKSVLTRVELRGGKASDRLKATVASAGLTELGAIEDALGLDPRVDALCASCGKEAVTLYRSSAAPEPGSKPAGLPARQRPADAVPSPDDRLFAARAYVAQQSQDGKTVSESQAIRVVRALPADRIFELADAYTSNLNPR